ncbi:MAG: 23S rRNA (pseudouridine(1915)-N(3))-methyltransferase RlmH [Nitrosomonas sp.]|nr:23S rRNA (pseudouridine(1915)-N(3))-methyltransferase RlmH [Nitrosomonas sp.]MBK7364881.1 23S rRNA (pseudouridine(1915)-N(3))-methyltransferase RlmH [Nitrosomonas sp.]
MKFNVLAVGNKMPDWIESGFMEYRKRMPKELSIELIEIKQVKDKNREQSLVAEYERIEKVLPTASFIIVMDEQGKQLSTQDLAASLINWMNLGKDITFIIGGADGLHPAIKQKADQILSLSRMTFPHGLVRVLLAEQLYRAMTILKHHPYHRA